MSETLILVLLHAGFQAGVEGNMRTILKTVNVNANYSQQREPVFPNGQFTARKAGGLLAKMPHPCDFRAQLW
ncbi:hypothetical protein PXK28_15070 [Phaeobacter gallaeciensis]|uniref:hypothetical protein n=1 Tax=Phaeobacter gallaeciensis TaxID=60890 RepID=UPI00237F0F6A|nr:hypothetical protein [Phaeobacter gallaeciensis]MDE4398579.1 hypothetical protein [Phaeobacter gallaeciensis]MDE4407245.1 hypothetical protein [Phaeobacter gallaeciensis]